MWNSSWINSGGESQKSQLIRAARQSKNKQNKRQRGQVKSCNVETPKVCHNPTCCIQTINRQKKEKRKKKENSVWSVLRDSRVSAAQLLQPMNPNLSSPNSPPAVGRVMSLYSWINAGAFQVPKSFTNISSSDISTSANRGRKRP